MTKARSQKLLKTLRSSLKKHYIVKLATRIHFLLLNVTFWAIAEMFILSLWRVAEMVKCEKSAPKALADKGRLQKGQNEHLKNDPKRYVYH